jgi:small acid-soluble spore protein H (minor)
MDLSRAQEISRSPNMIHVTYNGEPIYIQHINEQRETARIYPLNHPDDEKEVPVTHLQEH